MQEAEEQDTCRICSAPAEPDQPLFHPCKCSGTIRYIHQDCLTTWLAHSKKKNCDVCKHPYSFTKVYAPDMPSSLPPVLLVRRLLQHAFMAILFLIRAIAVAVIWLGVLPWVTVWTWRMYFVMGESTAWWISNRPRPSAPNEEIAYTTMPSPSVDATVPPPRTLIGQFTSHPKWISLSADIFTGQIIASLIVLTFVAVFLLREWISQNARPGVFEEEEIPAENRPAGPMAVPPHVVAQPALQQAPQPIVQHMPARPPGHQVVDVQPEVQPRAQTPVQRPPNIAIDPASLAALIELIETRDPSIAISKHDMDEITKEVIRRRRRAHAEQDGPTPLAEGEADEVILAYLREIQHDQEAADPELWMAVYNAMEPSARKRATLKVMKEHMQEVYGGMENLAPEGLQTLLVRRPRESDEREKKQKRIQYRKIIEQQRQDRDPLFQELRREIYPYGPPYVPPNSSVGPSSTSRYAEMFPPPPPLQIKDNLNPFPKVVLQPPNTDIPFSLRNWGPPASSNVPPAATPPVRPSLMPTSTPFTFAMDVPAASPSSLASYRAPEELRHSHAGSSASGPGIKFGFFDKAKIQQDNGKGKAKEGTEGGIEPSNLSGRFNQENVETTKAVVKDDWEVYKDPDESDVNFTSGYRPKGILHDSGKGKAKARRIVNLSDDDTDDTDADFHTSARSKGKRQQIETNDHSIREDNVNGEGYDTDEDIEADQRRYFRDRDEEPVGLNLDMEAFQRDFPRPAPATDGDDTSTDSDEYIGRDVLAGPVHHNNEEEEREFGLFDIGDPRRGEEEEGEERDLGLFEDEDAPWEDVDDDEEEEEERDMRQMPGGDIPVAPLPVGGLQAPAAGAGPEGGEEGEGNVEDEMEGALEAIGLRGPVFGVFQNAALMIFVLDTAIGLGIWIPFTIGKTAALLSLDPRRLMQVLHLPIRAMRIVTDPIVDFLAYILIDWIFPWLLRVVEGSFVFVGFIGWNALRALVGNNFAAKVADVSSKIVSASTNVAESVANLTLSLSFLSTTQATSQSNATLASSIPDYLGFTEPYFEALGREVRISSTKAQTAWIELALGSGPSNRVFAVFLGYVVAAFVLSIYLNILTVGNARTAGLAVRNAVRQQLLVLKVAAFIFIELVTFPLGCGVVLDLCTVWMFPGATLQTRILFFRQAPLTAMFYHWVAGTMFMYSFAVLLSGCRSVMRQGAMWFIKDPQDQNSHPIRDILDRPTLTQLRKICVSGLMYTFVVACVVASVACLVVLGSKSIMPFRWKNREPLSHVPVDLLFLHLVLPYTMHYFRPKRVIRSLATTVWKYLATRLRLTSYFFGGRHPQEEYSPRNWKDNFIRGDVHVVSEGDVADGTFRRVPATDNLSLPRDMRATVEVTADGEPIDEEARKLMDIQNAEAIKAKKNVNEDYTIVYMPPLFKYRIITFIFLLWVFGATVFGIAVALPILMGRNVFRKFSANDVHDGYSLIVGFYLIWSCYLITKAIDRLDKRRQRRSGDGPRANLYILVLKRGLLWIGKIAYMTFWLGIVIPVLLAIVIDLYMVLPIRFTLDPNLIPRIRVVDEWALGLLYGKIMFHAHRLHPPNRLTRGLRNIIQRGFTHPDPLLATKEVIAPLTLGLLGMIILPGALFRVVQHFFPHLPVDNRFVFMHVYPTVFIAAGSTRSIIAFGAMLHSWSQAIRDKEFLVEMRLKNHEPQSAAGPATEGSGEAEKKIDGEGANAPAEGPPHNLLAAAGAR